MPWGLAWLYCLGILLGLALGNQNLEMWTLTQDKECDLTGYLRVKLQYRNRLQYMKHYFPINYRVAVPYEGVLRVANITRLQKARVSERELRYLWVLVSLNATESVLDVLLEGHPSWQYLQEVQTLLENVQRITCPWALGVHLLGQTCGPLLSQLPGLPSPEPSDTNCNPAPSTGCGDWPSGGSCVISSEYPRPKPEAGAAQSLAGQLLPGHGAAVLLLL
uniref:Interleukin 34 n=1 Tax=Cricetulus griseus TaxID=10029 RepID=A0A8C2LHQ1_CRIGR